MVFSSSCSTCACDIEQLPFTAGALPEPDHAFGTFCARCFIFTRLEYIQASIRPVCLPPSTNGASRFAQRGTACPQTLLARAQSLLLHRNCWPVLPQDPSLASLDFNLRTGLNHFWSAQSADIHCTTGLFIRFCIISNVIRYQRRSSDIITATASLSSSVSWKVYTHQPQKRFPLRRKEAHQAWASSTSKWP